MAHKRILIDVTQLVHWPGQLAGIPRVIDEIATRYLDNQDATYVTWDKAANSYIQIDFARNREIRGQGIAYVNKDGSTFDPTNSSARRLADRAAQTSELAVLPVKVLKKARRLVKAKTPVRAYKTVTAQKDDVVLVIWGEWQDELFIAALQEARNHGAHLIQVVHDMLPIIAPQYSGSGNATVTMDNYNRQLLPLCSLILAVSQNTKKDVHEWLKTNKLTIPPIKVIRNGDDSATHTAQVPHEATFAASGLTGDDFILCVGTIEARKNHTLLYYVWKLAQSRDISLPKLVIIGRLGWHTENIYDIMTTDPATMNEFIFLHEASDAELDWAYQNCMFSIYPSFYEGWGIPIAESARRDVPVIASNTSSMPEIAGDLISYFSPYSVEEALEAIIKLLDPTSLKKAKAHLLQYKPTSWDITFQQVERYIEQI